jgi:3-hydroxyisobutyrate dehydrogenase-like beta-hydroxyacid dehydrogenase
MNSTATRPTVGFIGVGLMGHGMAKNIVTKGYRLVVLGHRNREPVEHLKTLGATEARTPRELAAQCDIVHLCVTGSPQVEANLRGPDGVIAGGRPGLVVIDCSTSNPVSTLALGDELRAAGMTLVDAPLSRTPVEAEAGTLDTMVGCDADTFARIEPVLRCWAGNVVHLGPLGLGHKMKLVNNFVAMGYAALFSEALAIARKAGLSVEQFHSVIGSGRMRSGFYDTFIQWSLVGNENAHRFTISEEQLRRDGSRRRRPEVRADAGRLHRPPQRPAARGGRTQADMTLDALAQRAYRIRRLALRMGEVQGQGYIGQALGIADVLAVAYRHAMKLRPDDPHWEGRDRFLLSQRPLRHRPLRRADRGRRHPRSELETYGSDDSRLPMSGMASYTPGMEMSGGSLGQGLSIAVGMALGLKRKGSGRFVYNAHVRRRARRGRRPGRP